MTLLSVSKAIFEEVLGPLQNIINDDRAAREMARERDADYDSHMGISRDQVKVQV